EFDRDLGGLGKDGDYIELFESLSSGYGFEHSITTWADARTPRDNKGNPLDVLVYADLRRNVLPTSKNIVAWEPFIEFRLRKKMLQTKVSRMIWGRPGTVRTDGDKPELKRTSAGIYHRIRHAGHYVTYNRGEFSTNLLRQVFGDLFYRRVDVANRKVVL